MSWEIYAMMAAPIAALAEAKADAKRWADAQGDTSKISAIIAHNKERSQRRHEIAVARASAPQINIVNRVYY